MKNILVSIILTCLLTASVSAQDSSKPFAEFERQLKSEPAGWAGDKSRLSAVFNAERKRLGESFELEVMKYLDADAEKHYWIAAFLEEPSYLHGSEPLFDLSLQIMRNGLVLLKGKTDEDSLGLVFKLNISAALVCHKLDLPSQALLHKTEADQMLRSNKDLRLYFPAMSKEELKTYQGLKSDIHPTIISGLPNAQFADQPEARIAGGVLNGKAISLPLPKYRVGNIRTQTRVVVRVVIDENGNVIWARAVEGKRTWKKAAEEAALSAKFRPTMLSGQAERVSGVLIYVFMSER